MRLFQPPDTSIRHGAAPRSSVSRRRFALRQLILGLLILGFLAPGLIGCDSEPTIPEPSIDIDKKVETLQQNVAKLQARTAEQTDAAAAQAQALDPDAGQPTSADAAAPPAAE